MMGDVEHQRFILAAYPEQMTIFFSDFDEELGLVCATSQCIVRSFAKWRMWDEQTRRQNEVMGSSEVTPESPGDFPMSQRA